MTALPAIVDLTGASVTEGGVKTWFTNLRAMLAETIGATGGGQADPTSGSVFRRNALYNGAMQVWQRGTGSTSSSAGSRTFLADRWYVNPSGAAVNQLRSTTIPTGSRAQYSLELQGATSVTTVLIGQRLLASDMPIIKRTITCQAYVQNLSGAAFNPSLLLGTPNASDDFTTVVNRLTQSIQSCPDSAWTQVSHTVDISAYTNIDNGLQVEIQIPSGSLVSGDTVRITEVQIAACSVVTPLDVSTFHQELSRCLPFYEKSFPHATAPAQSAGASGSVYLSQVVAASTAMSGAGVRFKAEKRASPTVTIYNPSAANAQVRNATTATDCTGSSGTGDIQGIIFSFTTPGGSAAGNQLNIHFSASAEP